MGTRGTWTTARLPLARLGASAPSAASRGEERPKGDLMQIAGASGGLDIDVSTRPTGDLMQIAAAGKGKVTLVLD
jgi:hypothetical protein